MAEDPKVKPRLDKATQDWFTYKYFRRPNMSGGPTVGITPPSITGVSSIPQPSAEQITEAMRNFPSLTRPQVQSTGYMVPTDAPAPTMPRAGGIAADAFVPGGAEGKEVNLPRSTTFDFPQFNFTPTASYQAPGQNELRGGSGDQEIRGNKGDLEQRDPRKAPNVRPMVDALNYLLEKNSINKIEKQQLGRKNMYFNAPSMSVRPIQDLSPEILAAQETAQNQIRSDYNGSDPVMNAISKNMATAQRGQMRTEQIAGRSAALASERSRWDTQMRENQKLSADTADKNLERAQDFSDYKLSARNAAEEARKTLNASFLSQVGLNIDTAAEFNLQRQSYEQQAKRQALQDRIAMAALLPEGKRVEEMEEIKKLQAEGAAQPLPYFSDAQKLWHITRSQKRIDKLRKNQLKK